MSRKIFWLVFFVVLLFTLIPLSASAIGMPPSLPAMASVNAPKTALGTAFTYQGQLKLNGSPVTATCNIAFKLFDAATVGTQVGSTLNPTVNIANGLFTTQLDFGAVFQGDERWLEITPQANCGASAVALTPRQQLTATPYARFSAAPWVTSAGSLSYSTGNVGIGTTSPAKALSVVGGISLNDNTRALWKLSAMVGQSGGRGADGNSAFFYNTDNSSFWRGVLVGDTANGGFVEAGSQDFGGGWVNRNLLLQHEGGNVGIGTTNPANKLSVNGGADFSNGTVGIGTTTPFTASVFDPSPLQVVANSPKATVATKRALAITTNDTTNPFALDIRLNGAATLANRSAYIQTTDFNLNDGGNILLQPSIGNVGIGITNPVDARLVIQTPTGTNAFSITDGNLKLFSRLNASNAEFGTLTNHDLIFTTGGFTSMQIDAAAGNMFPTGDGISSLGKSTNRWTAVFAQNGTIQTSDARLKKSVVNLNYGLNQVMQLRPVTFQWKDSSDARTHLGLIAQEVEKIIPEVIERSDDPAALLGMNYAGLVPVLIKAVQEQQTTLAYNDAKIKSLQIDNESLNARLTALEQRMNSVDATTRTDSNSPSISWFLFGGLIVLGMIVVQKRREG
ncbi:MAG: tail fiber domain-containing protein [Chloroflexi bacterium]|nr:tail fiber domain-containing protein [Chloroflexota bacterium]